MRVAQNKGRMMSRKNVTDEIVCQAYADEATGRLRIPLLMERTGEPEKVVYRAMERAYGHGLIEYGLGLQWGWLTDAGKALLSRRHKPDDEIDGDMAVLAENGL